MPKTGEANALSMATKDAKEGVPKLKPEDAFILRMKAPQLGMGLAA